MICPNGVSFMLDNIFMFSFSLYAYRDYGYVNLCIIKIFKRYNYQIWRFLRCFNNNFLKFSHSQLILKQLFLNEALLHSDGYHVLYENQT